ncbi:hypothetical protein M433DRAFT_78648, partial [Acidomyces richmondensis BFW]
RLLIMDGHGSHITANVIAHCMEHAIDLLILPPHTSHILQPLDVSVFSPLKRALATETDAASRLDSGRIPRNEWTSMYIRARYQAFTSSNIVSGWKTTGLWPLSPISVLEKLPTQPALQPSEQDNTTQPTGLNLSLLLSDPPDGTELRQANALCNSENLPTSVKRYITRLTQAFEATCSKNAILRKESISDFQFLSKQLVKVLLYLLTVFSTQEVLKIAREAEEAIADKNKRTRRRKPAAIKIEEQESVSSNSDFASWSRASWIGVGELLWCLSSLFLIKVACLSTSSALFGGPSIPGLLR